MSGVGPGAPGAPGAPGGPGGPEEELVVLLDEAGRGVGTHSKRSVHHSETPLHLAFSCYLFDGGGRLLVTRRAWHKPTWPGVWTNSVCGHPGPGEDLADAVRRRLLDEVGVRADRVTLVLPAFRYRAVMDDGVVENEMCPVFVATTGDDPVPAPEEVVEAAWVDWQAFRDEVLAGDRDVSPWCREQVAALPSDPVAAVAASEDGLPPAARP